MTVASRKVCQACGFGEKMRPQHYLQAKNAVGANCSWAPDRRVVDRRVVDRRVVDRRVGDSEGCRSEGFRAVGGLATIRVVEGQAVVSSGGFTS